MATKKVSAALPESAPVEAPAANIAQTLPLPPQPAATLTVTKEPTVADEWRRITAAGLHSPDPGAQGAGSASVPPDGAARTEAR